MQNNLIYLNVPRDEEEEAKRAGAKYSERWNACYTLGHYDHSRIKRWLPRQYHPDYTSPYLTINLIPHTSYHKNLHKLFLCNEDWDYVRKTVYRNAGYRCEICGGRGADHPVECNEYWEFSDHTDANSPKIQKLARLEALCPDCHKCVHFGNTMSHGKAEVAYRRFQLVNGWTHSQTDEAYHAARELWHERSKHQWTFDLSILNEFDIGTLVINQAKAAMMPNVVGIKVEWEAPKQAPPANAPKSIGRHKKPSLLAQVAFNLRNDIWCLNQWIRSNRWLFLSILLGFVLAAHHFGHTKWFLEQLSMGLRYAYWYVEELKK